MIHTLTSLFLALGSIQGVSAGQQEAARGERLDELGLWSRVGESVGADARGRTAGLELSLDYAGLERHLSSAPLQAWPGLVEERFVLSLPRPEGDIEHFWVMQTAVMEPGLAAKFPEIRAYAGRGIEDPRATLRAVIGPLGFHGTVQSPSDGWEVGRPIGDRGAPYSTHYLTLTESFLCESDPDGRVPAPDTEARQPESTAVVMRTFRFAVPCNYLFVEHVGGVTATLQLIVDMLHVMNGVLEAELAVRLVLPEGQDRLLETAAWDDPFEDDYHDLDELCDQSRELMRYELKDQFDDGLALILNPTGLSRGRHALGSFCNPDWKGFGAYSSPAQNPPVILERAIGSLHETGHALGAPHTFNSICGNQRDAEHAFEPDEGRTLMSYGGNCTHYYPERLAIFHFASIGLIRDYLSTVDCGAFETMPNLSPVVDGGPAMTIPRYTPFELTATGSDPDGQSVTYCWEQADLGPATNASDPDDGVGPINRTGALSASPMRTVPTLSNVLAGTFETDDKLPVLGRTYRWVVTARDGQGGVGQDFVTHTVDETSGPFFITTQNGPETWTAGDNYTIAWDKARTDLAPVNCQEVRVLLSTDGGQTFPLVLADATPNDGSITVRAPFVDSSTCRVKLKAVGNIFFDINNSDFRIDGEPIRMHVGTSGLVSEGGGVFGLPVLPADSGSGHWFHEEADANAPVTSDGFAIYPDGPYPPQWTLAIDLEGEPPCAFMAGMHLVDPGQPYSDAHAEADRGHLRVFARAHARTGQVVEEIVQCGGLETSTTASAVASAGAANADLVEVSSLGGPGETHPVFYRIHVHVEASGITGYTAWTRLVNRTTGVELVAVGLPPAESGGTITGTAWMTNGVLSIEQQLGCFAEGTGPGEQSFSIVDGTNTATLELWSVPGVTLTASSGTNDYEPAPCTDAPVLLGQSQSISVCNGSAVTVNMQTQANETIFYSWAIRKSDGQLEILTSNDTFFDDATMLSGFISGADTASPLVFLASRFPITASMTFVGSATTSCGSVSTNPITVTMIASGDSLWQQHPTHTSVCGGETASFSVQVQSTPGLTYRWQRTVWPFPWVDLFDGPQPDGTAMVSGATSPTLSISNADAAAGGSYRCSIGYACGPAFSFPAVLIVLPSGTTTLVAQPADVSVCPGEDALFEVTVESSEPAAYLWQWSPAESGSWTDLVDGQLPGSAAVVDGATTSSLHVFGLDATAAGLYRCAIIVGCDSLVSDGAELRVGSTVEWVHHPVDFESSRGATATFSVEVAHPEQWDYQWQMEMRPRGSGVWIDLADGPMPASSATFSGARAPTLQITRPDLHVATRYRCQITGSCDAGTSDVATLTLSRSVRTVPPVNVEDWSAPGTPLRKPATGGRM